MSATELAGYVCWDAKSADRILDVDALSVDASVFRAVHLPVAFRRLDSLPGDKGGFQDGPSQEYQEQQLLDDLLDPSTTYVLVSVIGPAGTGKSHLIRWLRMQMQSATDECRRRVILVPRAGTNLRSVIGLILQGMDGGVFTEIRQRLSVAADTVSPEIGRGRLLEGLAERIEHGDVEALVAALPTHDRTWIEWIKGKAPAFLRDDVFRQEWLVADGALATLYDMALGDADEVDRAEERRGLTASDLPLGIDAHKVQDASNASQQLYKHLVGGNARLQEALLSTMNHYLDDAIRDLLKVGVSDLGELLREVRRELQRQGRELVLLIEDVARLQGIDRQLLDGLLERSEDSVSEPLCPMRAVVGCTTGYYETLPNTFRTRCSFVVDLESSDTDGVSAAVVPMAVLYMNALRLGVSRLEAWQARSMEEVPNACEACSHRNMCHATFGQTDGMGHYPFNRLALRNTYGRTNAAGFKPRFLLSDVLKRTLVTYKSDIEQLRFPGGNYHQQFGGMSSRWKATQIADLERHSGGLANAARYKALLDLWSADQSLARGVYEAFGLKPVLERDPTEGRIAGTAGASTPTSEHPVRPSNPEGGGSHAETEPRDRPLLQALDAWARGDPLNQSDANQLRSIVFDAVQARMDWDSLRLLRGRQSAATSSACPFTRMSIVFEGQQTKNRAQELILVLPRDIGMNRTDVSLALQALVRYSVHGDWSGEGGRGFLLAAHALELVCAFVERSLRHPLGVPFSVTLAAAELLRLGAQLHGQPLASKQDPAGRLDAWYQDWPVSEGAATWERLAGAFAQAREELVELVEAYTLCAKGGSTQTKWFDAVQFSETLKGDVLPRQSMPAGGVEVLPKRFRVIGKLRSLFVEIGATALEEERKWWAAWLENVEQALEGGAFSEFRDSVSKTRDILDEEAVPYLEQTSAQALRDTSRSLNVAFVDRVLSLARNIRETDEASGSALIREVAYANTLRGTASKLSQYLDLAGRMKEQAESAIRHELGKLGEDSTQASLHEDIEAVLLSIAENLGAFEGGE